MEGKLSFHVVLSAVCSTLLNFLRFVQNRLPYSSRKKFWETLISKQNLADSRHLSTYYTFIDSCNTYSFSLLDRLRNLPGLRYIHIRILDEYLDFLYTEQQTLSSYSDGGYKKRKNDCLKSPKLLGQNSF